ncbi:MAG: Rieske 2Fe-2S domain-containing protein [Saprospiraceae bacterium]|nr:Rieske 2Fe-2S domain-containing protein [Saprospiraceae bacterium]MBK9631681.1 Rieske 2Fe-2S domain-containing protein [Saprospiraceae bacterium]
MDRKEFLKKCGFACLGGSTMMALLQSCASSNYFAKTILSNNQIIIPKSEFLEIKNNQTISRKYVLIKNAKFSFPIVVYSIAENVYSALLMECTHKGCELQAAGIYLVCPCHGSEFTNLGIVQNPPAEENLKTFEITTDHENIYLHI